MVHRITCMLLCLVFAAGCSGSESYSRNCDAESAGAAPCAKEGGKYTTALGDASVARERHIVMDECKKQPVQVCAKPQPCETPTCEPGPMPMPSKPVVALEQESSNQEPYDATFYEHYGINPFVDTEEDHLSTFAIDVDTASYTVARRYIDDGNLPPKDAVRVEEFINYFKYYYEPPEKDAFAIYTEAAPSRFGTEGVKMLKIGLKGKEIKEKDRKDAVLTFVIDVSGSMGRENRIGLVKRALHLLLNKMREGDRVGIVVYGTNARVITKPIEIEYRDALVDAINRLRPEGSTNAEQGLLFGYKMANKYFRKGCINRVILCSDGVANNGITEAGGILKKVKEYAGQDIYLTTVGFGMGNYNDVLMEKLADRGNGSYAYVDDLKEAKRIFQEDLTGTLQVIAKDVKIQVDFNPEVVRSYRLLGYENRDVADNKFRDDTVDGGEVGAGHSVTALYEVKLHDKPKGRMARVYVRYKDPDSGSVTEVAREVKAKDIKKSFAKASENFRYASAVAEFAEILRQSYWAKGSKLRDVFDLAVKLAPEFDNRKDVIEFVSLAGRAGRIKGEVTEQEISDIPEAAPVRSDDQSSTTGAGFLGGREPRLSHVLPLAMAAFCTVLCRIRLTGAVRSRKKETVL